MQVAVCPHLTVRGPPSSGLALCRVTRGPPFAADSGVTVSLRCRFPTSLDEHLPCRAGGPRAPMVRSLLSIWTFAGSSVGPRGTEPVERALTPQSLPAWGALLWSPTEEYAYYFPILPTTPSHPQTHTHRVRLNQDSFHCSTLLLKLSMNSVTSREQVEEAQLELEVEAPEEGSPAE